jgi:hypothetical protein
VGRSAVVPARITALTLTALAVTPLVVYGAMALAWEFFPEGRYGIHPTVTRFGPAALCAVVMLAWLLPSRAVPRAIRGTVVVCVVHAGLIAWASALWWWLEQNASQTGIDLWRSSELAFGPVALGATAIAATALLAAGARTHAEPPEWFRTWVTALLVHALLMGVTAPLLSAVWTDGYAEDPRCFAFVGIAVPTVATAMFLLSENRRRVRIAMAAVVVAATPAACVAIGLASHDGLQAYGVFGRLSGGPYRQGAAPIPGDRGIIVAPSIEDASPGRHAVLAVWRACTLYLVVVIATAAPASVALLRATPLVVQEPHARPVPMPTPSCPRRGDGGGCMYPL